MEERLRAEMEGRAIILLTNYIEDDLGDPEFEDLSISSRDHYGLMRSRASIKQKEGIVSAEYGGVTAKVYDLTRGYNIRKEFDQDISNMGTVRVNKEGNIVSLVTLDMTKLH